ncbi:MAG: nucleotidyltransferase family protein [Bacteroidota bacterium]|nr:nucleotidyltransferase family protein [Sediminibacterium sp.]
MKYDFKKHLIHSHLSLKDGLEILNDLGFDAIIFVVSVEGKLLGSLTDGDVRRGLLSDLNLKSEINNFLQPNPKFLKRGEYNIQEVIELRNSGFKVIPILDKNDVVVNVINFRYFKSYLPVDAVIMAGGRGERLKPLTDTIPKPLLPVGNKPIIKHNLDRLRLFGIDDFWISLRYLGDMIKDFIGDGIDDGINIKYITEQIPLGTIGSVSLIDDFQHDYLLVMNSDLLTNIDFEKFFIDFLESGADLSVATIPYNVNIPYAILSTSNNLVSSFQEKPTYTYFANAGIYLMKKSVCDLIPKDLFYNTTDLLQCLLNEKYKVISFPLRGYWLDIGKHDDYSKAQQDIEFINF